MRGLHLLNQMEGLQSLDLQMVYAIMCIVLATKLYVSAVADLGFCKGGSMSPWFEATPSFIL